LIEWRVNRVVIQKNSQGESMQLRLLDAEAERVVNLAIKVQARWWRLKSLCTLCEGKGKAAVRKDIRPREQRVC
jgi:hypothetical protein